ncbi:MAG: hypothetical protein ACWGQW_00280 [bacterium]
MSFEQASAIGVVVGQAASVLEVMPDMIILKNLSPAIMKTFARTFKKELAKTVEEEMVRRGAWELVKGGLTDAAKIEMGEITEEVLTQVMHNAFLMTVDENRELWDELGETAYTTALATLPMAIFGGATSYKASKPYLPVEIVDEVTSITEDLIEKHIPPDQAEAIAVAKVGEREIARAQMELAVEEEQASIPTPETIEEGVTVQEVEGIVEEPAIEEPAVESPVIVEPSADGFTAYLESDDGTRVPLAEYGSEKAAIKGAEKFLSTPANRARVEQRLSDEGTPATFNNAVEQFNKYRAQEKKPKIATPEIKEVVAEPYSDAMLHAFDVKIETQTERVKAVSQDLRLAKEALEAHLDTTVNFEASKLEEYNAKVEELEAKIAELELEKKAANKDKRALEKERSSYVAKRDAAEPKQSIAVSKSQWARFWAETRRMGLSKEQVHEKLGVTSIKEDWTNRGKTLAEALEALEVSEEVEVEVPSAGRLWDNATVTERMAFADKAGIAKTASNLNWGELNEVQQQRLTEAESAYKEAQATSNQIVMEKPPTPVENTDIDKRLMLEPFEDEQTKFRQSLLENNDIAQAVKPNPELAKIRTEVQNKIAMLKRQLDEYNELETGQDLTEEQKADKKQVKGEIKRMAREAGIRQKDLLGKDWSQLPPLDQAKLVVANLEDGSLEIGKLLELADVKHYVRFMEEITGLPFYQLYPRTRIAAGAAERNAERVLKRLKDIQGLHGVKTNPESLKKITQYINHKNPALSVPDVELTQGEAIIADLVEQVLAYYEPYVRYLRIISTKMTDKAFKAEFPDAVEAGKLNEIMDAQELVMAEDWDGLWTLCNNVTWGTITGYTPWMKAHASIFPKSIRMGTTRGEGRLFQRDSVEFDDTIGEHLLLDLVRYVKQIEAQWRLRNELESYDELWSIAKSKFKDSSRVEGQLKLWVKELQGIPTEGSGQILIDTVRRMWSQAMKGLFSHVYMAFRNLHQAAAFHPDRTELLRLFVQKMPADMKAKSLIYYDNFVTQLGGIRSDFLQTQAFEKFFLNRFTDWLNLYARSDNIPRMWSFMAGVNKARRATEGYIKSKQETKDVKKWLKDSGAVHLTTQEQNYLLQLLAMGEKEMNLSVPGLENITGYEYANMFIGHEIADITHFLYRRAFRAPAEMGTAGRIIFNLIVFPRGYFQRTFLQGNKVIDALSGDVEWSEAKAGFRDLLLLMAVGMFVSDWLTKISGRPRRSYDFLQIAQWQVGGLAIGVAQDATDIVSSIAGYLSGVITGDDEYRDQSLGRFEGLLNRVPDTFIPFWRNISDAFEAAVGIEDVGLTQAWRLLRDKVIDKNYEAPEIEEMERNLWEKIRKAALGGEPPEDTVFQETHQILYDAEERLGEQNFMHDYYTTKSFGSAIESASKKLPDDMFTMEYGWSPLVVFYMECQDKWEELYQLPSQPASTRQDKRKADTELEASLIFWGKYTKSVWAAGRDENGNLYFPDEEGKEVYELLQTWIAQYGLEPIMLPRADWADIEGY